jgi:broad specificity phosphatase PhoE
MRDLGIQFARGVAVTDDETGRHMAVDEEYGDATIGLIRDVLSQRGHHAVALMRHSAREFVPGRHDLENPLTPEGRDLALRLGELLPKAATIRAYASPPARCMDTAELILAGHARNGGRVTRHRPVEGLGVFYALDQMKMWKGLTAAGGLAPFVENWVAGRAPADALMPADVAADLILRILVARLAEPLAKPQIDICVSHDMTLYLMRTVLLGEPTSGPDVRFLDALVLYQADGDYWLTSHHGEPVRVTERLLTPAR